jgi:hypothetical protein
VKDVLWQQKKGRNIFLMEKKNIEENICVVYHLFFIASNFFFVLLVL